MLSIHTQKGHRSPLFYLVWSAPLVGVACVTTLMQYITFFATDVLGLKAAVVGMLLLVSKVFDGFTDVIAGFLIDKTHTKIGKARPYDIFYGLFSLGAMLLFFIPDIGQVGKAVLLFVMYSFVFSIFQTLYSCASTVYLSRAVDSNEDRISLASVGGLMSSLAAMVLAVIIPFLINSAGTNPASWRKLAMGICLPAMVLSYIRIFFIPEIRDVNDASERTNLSIKESAKLLFSNNYLLIFALALLLVNTSVNTVSNAQTYYFKYIVQDLTAITYVSIPAIVGPITIAFYPALSKKLGMRNFMAYALVLGVIGRLLPLLQLTNIPMLVIGSLLNGISYMPIYILCSNAIIDCMDYAEYKTGIRAEGIYTCASGFCSKVGLGLGSGLLGIVTALGGYDGTLAVQSASANTAIILSYTVLPAILYFISIIALYKFSLEKKLPEIRAELKERHHK